MSSHSSYFQPKCADSSEVIPCNPEHAQEFCNFIIFTPSKLPSDLILKEQIVRKETAQNVRSSYRQVFAGTERTVVMKQFLYDWAPPAYDYPCLWRNDKIATTQESPAPRAIFIDNNALWIGKNYRKQDAATIELERTRIELTFEKGAFSDREIVALCESLSPANLEMRDAILNTPFSLLSYNARHLGKVVSVPTGYWRHLRDESLFCFPFTKEEIVLRKSADFNEMILEPNEQGYRLDSAFGFGFDKDKIEEFELLFEHQKVAESFIRLLYTRVVSAHPIEIPPHISDQECVATELHTKKNQIVYYAHSKQCAFGSHEIVFNKGQFNVIMIVKPAPWTSQKWVQDLINRL